MFYFAESTRFAPTVLNSHFLHLIDTFSLPLDHRAARRALRDFTEEAGFEYFAYLYLGGPETFAVSNYPSEWQRIYLQNGYLLTDPVITTARHGPPVFLWSAELSRRKGFRRDVRQFFAEADRFGIRSGLSISIPAGFKNRSVFTLARRSPDVDGSALIDPTIAAVAVTHLQLRLWQGPYDISALASVRLSPREGECLRWFAEGMTIPDIALTLGIAYRSVRSYLDAATVKLRADNNRQASTIAVRLGLI